MPIDWRVKLYSERKGVTDVTEQERQNLITLNWLDELLIPNQIDRVVKVAVITRSATRRHCQP